MSSNIPKQDINEKGKGVCSEFPQMGEKQPFIRDWHLEPYPCTVPKCIEVVRLVGQFMELPTDYKMPDEVLPTYEFYAIVIEELRAQHKDMMAELKPIKERLSDVFYKWHNNHDTQLDGEVTKAVAKMKIYVTAWTKTVDEIEELKRSNAKLSSSAMPLEVPKIKK
ncbi:hypothetical protein CT0861_07449 [Colletotrichum tofieldiae]|uniref:Uncharacterized protein n=1 Tax=Colletotrichum tofieldiae TaxID=708197 RepID=A0A166TYH9_9PEZI|nr:hypothetical protein CT0861_07449 [Colletotrichum tofieldiae]